MRLAQRAAAASSASCPPGRRRGHGPQRHARQVVPRRLRHQLRALAPVVAVPHQPAAPPVVRHAERAELRLARRVGVLRARRRAGREGGAFGMRGAAAVGRVGRMAAGGRAAQAQSLVLATFLEERRKQRHAQAGTRASEQVRYKQRGTALPLSARSPRGPPRGTRSCRPPSPLPAPTPTPPAARGPRSRGPRRLTAAGAWRTRARWGRARRRRARRARRRRAATQRAQIEMAGLGA